MTIYDIEQYLAEVLQVNTFNDFCYNGIQIEGRPQPTLLAVGVSLNMAFLREAVRIGADVVVVHHGFFGKDFFRLHGFVKERVAYALSHGITVMAYHLPLDAHPEYGNSACIARGLGLAQHLTGRTQTFRSTRPLGAELAVEKRVDVGYIASYECPLSWGEFAQRVRHLFPASRLQIYQHSDTVRRVGIMTGGAASYLKAFEGQIDTFLCGETKEQTLHETAEMRLNFINAGHYYTETFGVRAIGELLEQRFGLRSQFIDVPNEV